MMSLLLDACRYDAERAERAASFSRRTLPLEPIAAGHCLDCGKPIYRAEHARGTVPARCPLHTAAHRRAVDSARHARHRAARR